MYLKEIRGMGLMLGVETIYKAKDIVKLAFDEKLLIIGAGENTIRIVPPLIITKDDVDVFIEKLRSAIDKL